MRIGNFLERGASSVRSLFQERQAVEKGRPSVAGPALIPSYEVGQEARNVFDYKKFGEEGYRQNVVIFVCCVAREAAISSTPLVLRRKSNPKTDTKETIFDHPVLDLLNDPINSPDNPESTGREFQGFITTCYDVAGNAFVEITRSGASLPARLDVLPPMCVKPIREADGTVKKFLYENGTIKRSIDAVNMLHFKNHPDILNPWLGLSPIAVAARNGDLDNRLVDYMVSLMVNGAIPFGELTNNLIENVPAETVFDMKEQMKTRFAGREAGNVLIHGSAWTYNPLSTAPKDMMPIDFLKVGECRIAAAYRVPVEIIGVLSGIDAKYENYNTARIVFYDNLEPTRTKFAAKWTQLARDFDPALFIEYDLTKVRGLSDVTVDQQRLWLDMYTNGRVITANELREKVGFAVLPPAEGDIYFDEPAATSEDDLANPSEDTPPPAEDQRRFPARAKMETYGRVPKHTKQIHNAADTSEVLFRKAFNKAVKETVSKIDMEMLERALTKEDFENAMDAVPWNHFIGELSKGMEAALTTTVKKGAGVALGNLSEIPVERHASVDLVFDATNPEAVKWIDAHGAELVTSVSDNTREAIKQLMKDSFTQGITPRDTAKQIEQYLGLNPQQAAAVSTRIGDYLADGSSMAYAIERGNSYAAQLIRKRAMNIARTESIVASNKGQEMLWQQAVDEDILEQNRVQRKWILTDDDRLCPECASFEGCTAGLNETFISNTGLKVQTPGQVHPQDRCTQGLIYVDAEATPKTLPPPPEVIDTPTTVSGPELTASEIEDTIASLQDKIPPLTNAEYVPWIDMDAIQQRKFVDSMRVNPTENEIDAISHYQGSGYHLINDYLRKGDSAFQYYENPERWKQITNERIADIDSAMSKSFVPENVVVRRGVYSDEVRDRFLEAERNGGFYQDNGYVSTSIGRGYFRGGVVIDIEVPAGTNGLYVPNATGRNVGSEYELLLPRGTQFFIKSVEKVGNNYHFRMQVIGVAAKP